MSQWGCAFLAGVNQILEKHVYEAENQCKHCENMIISMTSEVLQSKSAGKGDGWASFPMACGRTGLI